ncbi:hypothetical protein MB84_16575 [Pandoraea oxalativorans]|uniref:Uncharacterized protein n=1 Tax=Pandoraea oxalativorans TaxID=573737 RepID=A0A0E3YC10_9BURK|nr:hypothetical protein [Pandoraea oxalativorans]AKC70751.1 hypothetical protein MB84_16575 [Pandoraea oxalativorans]
MFARAFFGIWLDPRTRAPSLRERLLGEGSWTMASMHLSAERVAVLRAMWLYLVLGQLGWLICVLSAARGGGWGPSNS